MEEPQRGKGRSGRANVVAWVCGKGAAETPWMPENDGTSSRDRTGKISLLSVWEIIHGSVHSSIAGQEEGRHVIKGFGEGGKKESWLNWPRSKSV